MKIFNVRLGLATNSSSSHSMIFLKEGVEAFDYNGYHHATEPWENTTAEDDGDFGWQRFTAASQKAKMHYLSILLRDRLYHELPQNIADMVCKSATGMNSVPGYIDHQSFYLLPNAFGTELPDMEFFEALKTYFMQERLVILGGNDNTSNKHPLDDGTTFRLPLPRDCGHKNAYVCRYDADNDYWVMFSREDGSKIRFRLTTDPTKMGVVPEKACAPELVDIKITDFCPYGCEFCYQSSTAKGQHADNYQMYNLAQALKQLKVFEVALGGGEPTLHPDFENILRQFKEAGIVPNFTTRNIQWLRDPLKWTKYLEHMGAFAYSVGTEKEIKELATLLDFNGISHDRANLHFVMGTMSKYTFERMLKTSTECDLSVTLLGYKRHGFGLDYVHEPYHWWLDVVKAEGENRHWGAKISVDTVMAKEYEQQILAANVPEWLFTTEEGKFSCYIDAVNGTMGPSSFCHPEAMVSIDEESEGRYRDLEKVIEEVFKCF